MWHMPEGITRIMRQRRRYTQTAIRMASAPETDAVMNTVCVRTEETARGARIKVSAQEQGIIREEDTDRDTIINQEENP